VTVVVLMRSAKSQKADVLSLARLLGANKRRLDGILYCLTASTVLRYSLKVRTMMLSPRGQSGPEAKLWPRAQRFGLGLGLEALASASAWPRSRCRIIVIGHFSGKNRVKFGNFVNFSGNNLNSYVDNNYLVLFA